MKGIINKVTTKIKPIEGNKDDIFIACASFEDRTTAITDRFSKKYRIMKSFIFKYDEKNMTNLRDINFEKIKTKIELHSENTYPIISNHHNPLEGIHKLKDLCVHNSISMENKNISLNITTFTKQYILVLLKFVESQKPRHLRVFYAEPKDYGVKWNKPLSSGLVDIVSVPSYGGHYYSNKENLLILQLGYEEDRAYGLWEKSAPHKTIVLIGKPSFKKSWEGRVEKINKKLLSKLSKDSIHYIPTLNPFEVSKNLDDLIEKHSQKFNISISPLGPKPQVLGCYLSVIRHPDVQIIYAIPKYHEEEYFSKKVGKIWEYR